MVIVETPSELQDFLRYWGSESSIVVPIWEDLSKHPVNNFISFLYVRFPHMDYIVSFNHNDCISIECDLSHSTQIKKVYNRKGLLQTNLGIQNTYDLQAYSFFNHHEMVTTDTFTERLTNFYNRLGLYDNLGKCIPIMKFGEVLKEFTNNISYFVEPSWIDHTLIPTLSRIEQTGININKKNFIDKWPHSSKHVITTHSDYKVYTEYNPYTITSRPSNRHGGVNYSALNKTDGTREIFKPSPNHIFLQFDYDAYHVRIIGKLIDYPLPNTSVHQWLSDLYGVGYDESKGITFKILYGGVPDEYKHIEFFFKVDRLISTMYDEAIKCGYIQTMKGRRIPLEWIVDHNPQKVFNYLLQATETEYNIEIIKKLYEHNIDSLVLYTYDSFLFNFDLNLDPSDALIIKSIIESFNFPTKASWGTDYSKV